MNIHTYTHTYKSRPRSKKLRRPNTEYFETNGYQALTPLTKWSQPRFLGFSLYIVEILAGPANKSVYKDLFLKCVCEGENGATDKPHSVAIIIADYIRVCYPLHKLSSVVWSFSRLSDVLFNVIYVRQTCDLWSTLAKDSRSLKDLKNSWGM